MVINKNRQLYFLLALILGVLCLVFLVFRPFFSPLLLALTVSIACKPLYHRIKKGLGTQHYGVAALLTIFLFVIFVVTPVAFLGIQIVNEARSLHTALVDGGITLTGALGQLGGQLNQFLPAEQALSLNIDQYVSQGLTWVMQNFGSIFSNVAKFLAGAFVFFIAFYYFLKDGDKLKKLLIAVSPLSENDDETIFKKLSLAVTAVVRGSLIVAFVQGILAIAGFTIFGLPNPVLFGTLTAIASLVPGVGTSLVLVPAIAYLFLTGDTFHAVGLFIWGAAVVGLIDNFLGPRLIGSRMRLHPLAVFLAVLGGIVAFGPIGVIVGPLIISLFSALLDVYLYCTRNINTDQAICN